MKAHKQHGGPRKGAGRKAQNPELGPRKKISITVRADHYAAIREDPVGEIEKALDAYLNAPPE